MLESSFALDDFIRLRLTSGASPPPIEDEVEFEEAEEEEVRPSSRSSAI